MIRDFIFATGEYYHAYNRGTDKRIIFLDDHDYKRFVMLMYLCNSSKKVDLREHFNEGRTFVDLFEVDRGKKLVDIGAYCLMPNHFHLLLHECTDFGISEFMGKLCTAYVMYFNKRHKRTGALFEGRFKAKHANSDEYLKYLFAYIHLNIIDLIDSGWKDRRATDFVLAAKFLHEYPYSSFIDYEEKEIRNARMESKILHMESFPEYFCDESFSFTEYVQEWLLFEENLSPIKTSTKDGPL